VCPFRPPAGQHSASFSRLPLVWLHPVFRYPLIDVDASKPPTRAQAERPKFALSDEAANSEGMAVQVFGGFLMVIISGFSTALFFFISRPFGAPPSARYRATSSIDPRRQASVHSWRRK